MIAIKDMLTLIYSRGDLLRLLNYIDSSKFTEIINEFNVSIIPKSILVRFILNVSTSFILNRLGLYFMSIIDYIITHDDNLFLINKLLSKHKSLKISRKNSLKYLFHNISMNIYQKNYIEIFNLLLPHVLNSYSYFKVKDYYNSTVISYLQNLNNSQDVSNLIDKVKLLMKKSSD